MSLRSEFRAFLGVVGLLLLIPLFGGISGAFGGAESLALLFGETRTPAVSPTLESNLRAISCAFLSWVLLVTWSLADMPARAGAFRIVLACGFLAGCARLTGWVADGYPGAAPVAIMAIELAALPPLALWHARLMRRLPRPAADH